MWREHRGLGGAAVAERAGIGSDLLAEIGAGPHDATVATLRRSAPLLGVTLDDLAG